MKIVSLHVSSFGKLKNLDLQFDAGLNVLQQKNGFGKTTLANFIRAMLYGFDYRRVKRGTESVTDASVWATWNSTEKIGGNLVVEHNGATYRVERYFGLTAKGETLSVTNLNTGKAENIPAPGEYFLGLTAESYDRSAYFPQEAVEMSSTENFDTRLAGVVQNAENYDAVQDKLRKLRKDLKYERGDGGEIYNLETRKLNLQRQLAECENATRRQREIDARLSQIAAEKVRLQREADAAAAEISRLQGQVAQQGNSANASAREKAEQLRLKLARLQDFETDKAACDALAEKIEKTPTLAKKQRAIHWPLLIVALCLAAIGGVLAIWVLVAGLCVLAAGVLLAVVSFFVKHPITTLPSGELDYYLTEYFNIAGKYVYAKDMDFSTLQKELWKAYNNYVGDRREYQALVDAMPQTPSDTSAAEKLPQLQQTFAAMQAKQQQLAREEGSLCAERKILNADTTVIREQILAVEQNLAQARRQYDVATKTSQLLAQAKENLSVSYLPNLCKRCGQLLSEITAANYQPVIDRNFTIKLQVGGLTKSLDDFSRGIREITLLCFRVALSELLFGGAIPFVVIDDAFVNFDEENFLRATALVRKLSQRAQVIYFTCHNRLGNLK